MKVARTMISLNLHCQISSQSIVFLSFCKVPMLVRLLHVTLWAFKFNSFWKIISNRFFIKQIQFSFRKKNKMNMLLAIISWGANSWESGIVSCWRGRCFGRCRTKVHLLFYFNIFSLIKIVLRWQNCVQSSYEIFNIQILLFTNSWAAHQAPFGPTDLQVQIFGALWAACAVPLFASTIGKSQALAPLLESVRSVISTTIKLIWK